MNQGNFQNMGMPRPAQQGNPQPGGMQRNGGASSDIRPHIMRELSNRPTPPGWQQTVPLQNRVVLIQQMVTQLALVKPEHNLSKTFSTAMAFEKQEFETCPDRQTYEAHFKTHLKRIFDIRQSQAEQQQQFLNPQQPQMALMQQQMAMQGMNPNQLNHNQFPQAFAMPQQAPVQNLGGQMQQHPSQIQRPVQPANPMEMQLQMVNGQPVPNMPQRAPQNQGQQQFTQQEQQQIMQLAESMAQNVSPEQLNNVQRMVMSMPADQRQQMQNQGINPAQAVFRSHAIKRFLQDRAIQQQRAGPGPHPLDRGVVNRPPSQVPMPQGQQVPPPSTSQRHDPSFDQFLGQQQDALRHQEAGQVVVPASQAAPPQVRGTPHSQPQGQFGARPMQPPNNFQQQPPVAWNTTQDQHQNVSHTTQTQAQPQIPPQTPNFANMPVQVPQQQALQGQLGGLDNTRAQRTPQQNPNMPTLNRPLNPPNQAQSSQRQVQNTPTNGVRNASGGQQAATTKGQPNVGQQSAQPNLQKFQRYIANIPEPQRTAFLAQFRQRQERKKAEEATAQASAQNAPVAPMGGQGGKSQSAPKANANVPPPMTNPVNRVNGQPQVAPQSGLQNGARGQQQRFPPISLDESTTRIMDRVEFPRGLLNLAGENAKVPEHIKQWGQLKQWVVQNSNILPPGSIQKVMGLQSIVYQQKVAQTNQQKEVLNQAPSQGNTKPAQPGVAPPAQMVAPNSSHTPIPASTTQAPNSSMPVLPQPTIHEITAARAQLPANLKPASDEQLRVMILNKRRNEYFKAMQGQPNLTPQQQLQLQQHRMGVLRMQQQQQQQQQQANGQQTQIPMQPNQHDQLQPSQRGQNQQPQPGQQWPQPQTAQKLAQTHPQQPKQPQSNRSAPQASVPANQKGGKGNNNNDDVIEVPDPKLSQQHVRPSNTKGSQFQPQSHLQPPSSNSIAHITPEKYNALPPEQKARFQEQQRRLQMENAQRAQRLAQNAQGQRPTEAVNRTAAPNAGRDERVKELRSEVMRNMPARQPIPMSPNTRARMIEKLKSAGSMAQRLESSLPLYLSLSKDEEMTKDLLRSKIAVQQQLKETQSGETCPVDNFTMSLDELEATNTKLHQYFSMMMSTKVPKTAPQQQLSAANLQSQQEALNKARAANLQKSHANNNNSNRPPAAPTTSHAPFSIGGQSPQGIPQYTPTKNELTQEKLVLPLTKKRKPNNVASPSTPAQAPTPAAANKLSPFAKIESPDTQRPPAVTPVIKCPMANCETGTAGFSTKADLEKHIADAHELKEPVIKDPLDAAAYAIESMRLALNLDQNGRPKPPQEQNSEPMQAHAMKASLSAQGQNSVKQEAATPMSRNPTQTGPSPSSNLLKTPQAAANIKTPASDAKSTGKDIKAISVAKSPAVAAPDPWANSHVKPEWFKQVFSEVADLNRPVSNDLINDWLERNPFTPSTSPSSGVPSKDSPHKSDISVNDTLNINVKSDDWLPPEWFDDGLPSDMAALDVADFMDMDWEATFGKPEDEDEDEVTANGKRRRERDPLEPSDEWLKAWAPDKWEEATKADEGRKI